MTQMRTSILSIALLMLVATASAFAQNQTPPQPIEKPAAALSTKIEDVSKWTKQQWYAAKAKWIKEKENGSVAKIRQLKKSFPVAKVGRFFIAA
jgi:hypothetical protein